MYFRQKNYNEIFFVFVLTGIFFLFAFAFIDAKGGDYTYFLPKLLDTHFFYKVNGFKLQEYTASYCAGSFVFANPQSISLSIPQLLLFFFNPLDSIRLTFVFSSLIGFFGIYFVGLKLGLEKISAIFSAVVFSLCGFLLVRMVMGHLTFYNMAFAPLIAYYVMRASDYFSVKSFFSSFIFIAIASLIVSMTIYSGAAAILPQIIFIVVFLSMIYSIKNKIFFPQTLVLIFVLLLSALISLPKLEASISLLNNFSRDFYQIGGFSNINEIIKYLFSAFFWFPDLSSINSVVANKRFLVGFTESYYSLSPAYLLLLFLLFRKTVHLKLYEIIKNNKTISILSISSVLLVVFVHYYSSSWVNFLQNIPVINQSSNMFRWNYVLIPILSIFAGMVLNIWSQDKRKVFFLVIIFTVLSSSFQYYTIKSFQSEMVSYNPKNILRAWEDITFNGAILPPIKSIGLFEEKQDDGIIKIHHKPQYDKLYIAGISNAMCYEPLFGYRLEKSNMWKLKPDSIYLENSKNELNFNNPACYVYPEENECRVGDRFKSSQRDLLKRLASRQPIYFNFSRLREWSNIISLYTIGFVIIFFIIGFIILTYKKYGKNN